ncbi:hypothetical protein GCM10007079_49490 [Nocardiopsis terrae]|nr:hypothetical protein GCM10007079_49490 [Nocardiopsis terrae]
MCVPSPPTPASTPKRGTPTRLAYMIERGELPHWMHVTRQRREQAGREARETEQVRAKVHALVEPVPGTRRGRHRAPRRRKDWPAVAVSATLLLGLAAAETIGQGVFRAAGLL